MSAADFLSTFRVHRRDIVLPAGFNLYLAIFLGATFLFQMMLVPQFLNPIRTPLRIALYASSIGMLFLVRGRFRWTVATNFAVFISGMFCLQILNPSNNSFIAACAAIVFNFAILSPVFWVGRLRLDASNLRFLFVCLWTFNFASSAIGILEVYFPSRFGRESKIATDMNSEFAEGLKVTLANGKTVYRPMGLTDTPGGAAASGYTTMLLATGLLLQRFSLTLRAAFFVSIMCGLFCIYLSQVRSLLVLAGICEIVIFAALSVRGQLFRVSGLLVVFPFLIAGATLWAFSVGGDQVSDRVKTLSETTASSVYYSNRGTFLEDTIYRQIPEYPFGAGLGRWGMMYQYFGDRSSVAPPVLWAEIQLTAWVFDGGVPLVALYYITILVYIVGALRVAIYKQGLIADYATIVLALNIATLANTFSYIPFIGQSGLTFWLINATFFGAEYRESIMNALGRRIPSVQKVGELNAN